MNLDIPTLLHCDRDDIIQVCPAHLGQGYVQEIPLREDLSLFIIDYTFDRPLSVDASGDQRGRNVPIIWGSEPLHRNCANCGDRGGRGDGVRRRSLFFQQFMGLVSSQISTG